VIRKKTIISSLDRLFNRDVYFDSTLGEALPDPLNLNWIIPAKERETKSYSVFPLAYAFIGNTVFFI